MIYKLQNKDWEGLISFLLIKGERYMNYKDTVRENILDADGMNQVNSHIINADIVMDVLDDIKVELQFIKDNLLKVKDETDIEMVKEWLKELIRKLF